MSSLISIPDEPESITLEAIERAMREVGIVTDSVSMKDLHSVTFGPEPYVTVVYTKVRGKETIHATRQIPIT